jgi:hypothetical protein
MIAREVAKKLMDSYGGAANDFLKAEPLYEGRFSTPGSDQGGYPASYGSSSDGGLSIFLYVGSTLPDIGYFHIMTEAGTSVCSDLLHYNNTGDFTRALIDVVKTGENMSNEYKNNMAALCIGQISHVFGDIIVHPYINTLAGAYHKQPAGSSTHRNVEVHMDSMLAQKYFGYKNVTEGSWQDFYREKSPRTSYAGSWGGLSDPWPGESDGNRDKNKAIMDRRITVFDIVAYCFDFIYHEATVDRQYWLDSYSNFHRVVIGTGYQTASTIGGLLVPNKPDSKMVDIFKRDDLSRYTTKATEKAVDACKVALDYLDGKTTDAELTKAIRNWNLDTGYRYALYNKGSKINIKYEHSWIYYGL